MNERMNDCSILWWRVCYFVIYGDNCVHSDWLICSQLSRWFVNRFFTFVAILWDPYQFLGNPAELSGILMGS